MAVRRAEGTLSVPRAMLAEGGVLPPLNLLESRGRTEEEDEEPHVGLSKHDSVFPGTSMGHFQSPLGINEEGHMGRAGTGCTLRPQAQSPCQYDVRASLRPDWVWSSCEGLPQVVARTVSSRGRGS